MLQKFDDSKKFLMDGNTHLGEYQTSFYYFGGFCNGPKCTRLNDLLTDWLIKLLTWLFERLKLINWLIDKKNSVIDNKLIVWNIFIKVLLLKFLNLLETNW